MWAWVVIRSSGPVCVRSEQSHVAFRGVFYILVNGSLGTIMTKHLFAGNCTLL